jgi:hypothetical protein
MSFLFPSIKKPDPPPNTPTRADASAVAAGDRAYRPYSSFISTGATSGLKSRASTMKRSLIGGSGQ